MDAIFQLPLFTLVVIQVFMSLGLLLPKSVSLPVAQLLRKFKTNTAANSVMWTLAVTLGGLLISCLFELVRNFERSKQADVRVVVGTIDYLRAQLSCALCTLNLALLFLNRALGEALVAWNHSTKNLEAMQRQVKGLRAEYERVTNKGSGGQDAQGDSEADALKKKVDRLIAEKDKLQSSVEEAEKAKAGAEASVVAMKSQLKGFDAEYDRVREENAFLKRKLAGHGDQQFIDELHGTGGKKDD